MSGTTAYVDSGDGVYIYKVDLSTNAVTTFVSSCGCSLIGLNQTATKLFVNQTGQGIRVLNPATAATIGLIAPPSGIASFLGDASLSADASTILVGDQYKAVGPTGPAQYGAPAVLLADHTVGIIRGFRGRTVEAAKSGGR